MVQVLGLGKRQQHVRGQGEEVGGGGARGRGREGREGFVCIAAEAAQQQMEQVGVVIEKTREG